MATLMGSLKNFRFELPINRLDTRLYLRMLGYLRPYRTRFIIAILSALPVALTQGVVAWLVGPFTDKLLKDQDYTILLWVPVLLISATIIQGACQYINEYCTSYIGQKITQTMRLELFAKIATMELSYFKKSTVADLLTRYSQDPAQLQSAINDNLQDFIVKVASIIGLASVLFYRNWQYAILSLLIISVIVVPLSIISKKIRRMDHATRALTSSLYVMFIEYCNGYKIAKAFQLDRHFLELYERRLQDYFSVAMRINKAGIVLKPVMQMIASVGISVVFVIGVYQIQAQQMTPGDLTSFIVALILLISPIKTVGSIISKIQRILAPAERVFEKMDLVPTIQDAPASKTIGRFETIAFENVSFGYEPDKPVLQNINLSVDAGKTIALVGPSGGGKSTFVDLIPRFIDPETGRVTMNGIDLKALSLEDIRQQVAIVSQDAVIFNSTIRDNVTLGRLGASEAEVRKAMDMAYLTSWVDTLELNWETPVGESGALLSGGQKQRISIARAFLKNAPILILDEATSALDNESESIVQKALLNLLEGRTVFVVAHRLSTIQHADQILVLEKGRIVESGSHDVLLQNPEGLYHRLYHLQFRDDPQAVLI